MLEKIKKDILNKKGSMYRFKINNIRNKCDIIDGTINEVYDRIFIVNSKDNIQVSFSYSDVLTGIVEIQDKMC